MGLGGRLFGGLSLFFNGKLCFDFLGESVNVHLLVLGASLSVFSLSDCVGAGLAGAKLQGSCR
jgi:hypothetical protein